MLDLVTANSPVRPEDVRASLDEIAREGARRMLIEALQVEVSEYIEKHRELRDDAGKRLVVRHGKAQPRNLTLGCGTIQVQAPRVRDRRPGERFSSQILPAYMRKSPKVENLLPILYLKGLSTSDFRSALAELLGEGVTGSLHRVSSSRSGHGRGILPHGKSGGSRIAMSTSSPMESTSACALVKTNGSACWC